MSDVRGKMYDVSPPPSDFMPLSLGGLAQLARAPALQAGGQRFESVILHYSGADPLCIKHYALSIEKEIFDILTQARL